MSSPDNLDPVVKMFVNHRGTPNEFKKELIQIFGDEEKVNEAYKKFLELTGRPKFLTPPPMLVEDRLAEGWYPGADYYQDAKFWPALRDQLLKSHQ